MQDLFERISNGHTFEQVANDLTVTAAYHDGSRQYKARNEALDLEAFGLDASEAKRHLRAAMALKLEIEFNKQFKPAAELAPVL